MPITVGSSLAKNPKHLMPAQLPPQHRHLVLVYPMQLKNMLGRVHTDADNLAHGRLLCLRVFNDLNLAHAMPSGAVHPNKAPR